CRLDAAHSRRDPESRSRAPHRPSRRETVYESPDRRCQGWCRHRNEPDPRPAVAVFGPRLPDAPCSPDRHSLDVAADDSYTVGMMMPRTATKAILAAALLIQNALALQAQADDEFFKGKTITILVGAGIGGGYDTSTRIFAKHFANHIPGN